MGQDPTTTELAIVRFEDGWSVVNQDRRWGRFDYRVDAEEAALRLALIARRQKRRVKLMVQDDDGQLRLFDQGDAREADIADSSRAKTSD